MLALSKLPFDQDPQSLSLSKLQDTTQANIPEQEGRTVASSCSHTADRKEGQRQTPNECPVLGLISRVGTDTALAIQGHRNQIKRAQESHGPAALTIRPCRLLWEWAPLLLLLRVPTK